MKSGLFVSLIISSFKSSLALESTELVESDPDWEWYAESESESLLKVDITVNGLGWLEQSSSDFFRLTIGNIDRRCIVFGDRRIVVLVLRDIWN